MTTNRLVLAGVAELADLLQVKRTTISQWHARGFPGGNGFPEPYANLAMGPVWEQDKVVEWYQKYTPQRQAKKVGRLPDEYQGATLVEEQGG